MRAGEDTGPRTRSGRPRKTTARVDAVIHRAAIIDPFITSTEIKREHADLLSNVTTRTIRRRLVSKFRTTSKKPSKKPLLTARMREKRLSFCRRYKDWNSERWHRVLFSDECNFDMGPASRQYVRRPRGSSPFNPRYTLKTKKHPPSVMVWGCFSFHRRGALTFLPTNSSMNAAKYIEVLEEKLPTFMDLCETSIFQHDMAPCHTARSVKSWFERDGIEVLDWPGNSPDLNPIENLWQIVKTKLKGQYFRNMSEFKEGIKKIWCTGISRETCEALVDSMPRRIGAVLKNKGYPTKY